MRTLLKSLLIIVGLASFSLYAQKAENVPVKLDADKKLTKQLLTPTQQDIALAESEGFNVFKLLPRGMFDYEKNALSLRGGGAYYSFTKRSHSYNEIPQISLEKNHLKVGFNGANYGLIADLEQSTPELAKLTAEGEFLLQYTPPKFEPEIRAEAGKSRNYESGGMIFKSRVPVRVGNSYILRAITFGQADTLVFFKINRQNADGSLIIFWKKIKDFTTPSILTRTDEELKAEILTALHKKGFNQVTVDSKDHIVVLRGCVSGKNLGEAVMAAMEAKPKKIENQISKCD